MHYLLHRALWLCSHLLQQQRLDVKRVQSPVSRASEQGHELIMIGLAWTHLQGWWSAWEAEGHNQTYCWAILVLLLGPLAALCPLPTGLLEQRMSGLLAEGLRLLPESQQSLWADWNLSHPGACQGTCKQNNRHTVRHAYSRSHTRLVIGPHERLRPAVPSSFWQISSLSVSPFFNFFFFYPRMYSLSLYSIAFVQKEASVPHCTTPATS